MCVEFIPLDGPASEAQIKLVRSRFPAFCSGLTNEDLLYIKSLLDEKKSAEEIFLDYNVILPELPEAEVNWKYGLKSFHHEIRICPTTFRPESKDWEQSALEVFGLTKKELFSGCRYIEQFLLKYREFPTKDELLVFCYNRAVESKLLSTLPFET